MLSGAADGGTVLTLVHECLDALAAAMPRSPETPARLGVRAR